MKINLHVLFVLTLLVFLFKFVLSSAFTYQHLRELKTEKDWALIKQVVSIQKNIWNENVSPLKEKLPFGLQIHVVSQQPETNRTADFAIQGGEVTPAQALEWFHFLNRHHSLTLTGPLKQQDTYVTYVLQDPINLSGLIDSLWVSLVLIFLVLLWWWIFVYYEKKLPLRVFNALTEEDGSTEKTDPAIQRLKQKIEGYYQEKNLMLSALSHDIRTPLTEAFLTLDLVESREFKVIADSLRKNLEDINTIVKTSLSYAKDEKNLDKKAVELVSFFQSIVSGYAAQGSAISFKSNVPKVEGKIESALMQRLLTNLIDNALRHGTQVDISLSYPKSAHEIVLAVEDNGPGVNDDNLSKLGTPYYREDQSRSSSTGGTGLGLAIVKKIAALHGGHVEFRNPSNIEKTGFCVRVVIPVRF
jgi:signal transduction histidine kinase